MGNHDVRTPDGYLDMAEAALHLAGRPHRNTVYRWCTDGAMVNGDRIKLRSQRVGGRIFTRREWIDEFESAVNAERPPRPAPSRVREKRSRAEQQQHDAAVLRSAREMSLL